MSKFNEAMAENGRKGGQARAKKYYKRISDVITLFYEEPNLTQQQIAKKIGVSQSFVSTHTKDLEKLYLSSKDNRLAESLKRIDIIFNKLVLEVSLEKPTRRTNKIHKV